LHVGSARVVLANWLLARRLGGRVTLRVAEAGAGSEAAEAIRRDLRWLGLDWDGEVRQGAEPERYAAAAATLRGAGRLYPCFESEAELNAKRHRRVRQGRPATYDRAMLRLTAAERQAAEAGGKRPYWRFLLSNRTVTWQDQIRGACEVKLTSVSDPILLRADGTPLPALAGVVDDIAMEISDVVRSEEQLTATGVAIDLRAALGDDRAIPRYAHVPSLADAGNSKLARRIAGRTVRSLRHDGVEAAALTAYLARLGTRLPAKILPLDALAAGFELSGIAPTQPRFDATALLALNRDVLRALDFAAVADRLPAGATEAFWLAVRDELDLLCEARGWWDVVAGTIVPPEVPERDFLAAALELLPPEPWNGTVWQDWRDALEQATGRRGDALSEPLRLALTGEDRGPKLSALLPLIGRARAVNRLQVAAA
jgi:glutamyl-tRNA synthetase